MNRNNNQGNGARGNKKFDNNSNWRAENNNNNKYKENNRNNNNRNDRNSNQNRGRGGSNQGHRGGRGGSRGRGGKDGYSNRDYDNHRDNRQRKTYIPPDFTKDLDRKVTEAKREWIDNHEEDDYDTPLEYRYKKSLVNFDRMRERINKSGFDENIKRKLIELEIGMLSKNLPVYAYRDELINTCFTNDVSLLTADTGAGKSILTPIFCAMHILLTRNKTCPDITIYVSQPRKFAARNIKNQIKSLIGDLGTVISTKKIDETNLTDILPRIILTTEYGLLNRIIGTPKYINEFKIIMIDEAHERSVYVDSLLSMIKTNLIKQNKDAKNDDEKVHAIIASATIDTKSFERFIPEIKTIIVRGQCFKVETKETMLKKTKFSRDYIDIIVNKIIDSYKDKRSDHIGHSLCFLCGKNEILYAYDKFRQLCEKENDLTLFRIPDSYESIRKVQEWGERTKLDATKQKKNNCSFILYPFILHSQIPPYLQDRILYEDCGDIIKKVVFTTNIAETSVTVPGVDRVFDSGLFKIPKYIPENRTEIIITRQINESSRKQRMGRAGRTCNGDYYQFNWPESDDRNGYSILDNDIPEIKRRDLSLLLLLLRCNGLHLEELELPDKPDSDYLKVAKRTLININAIESVPPYLPTERGRLYSLYQISPELACDFIDISKKCGCIHLSAVCAAVIAVGTSLLYWGSGNGDSLSEAVLKHSQFYNPYSQVVTLMNALVFLERKQYDENCAYDCNINIKFAYSAKDLIDQLIIIKNHKCGSCKDYSTDANSPFAKKSLEIANEYVKRHKLRNNDKDCIAIFHNLDIKTTVGENNNTDDSEVHFYYELLNKKDDGLYRSSPIGTKLKEFQEMIVNGTLPLRVVYFSKIKTTDLSNTNLLNGFLGLCTKIDSEESDPIIEKVNDEPLSSLDQEIYMNLLSTFCKPVKIPIRGDKEKADIFVIIINNEKGKMTKLLKRIKENFGLLKEYYYKYFIMNNCPSIGQYVVSKENCEVLHMQLNKDDGEENLPLIYHTDIDQLLDILLSTKCECGYLCNSINMQISDFTQICKSQIQLIFPNVEERDKYLEEERIEIEKQEEGEGEGEGEERGERKKLEQIKEYDTNANIMNNSNHDSNNNLSQIEESICIEILPNINVARDSQLLYISYSSNAEKSYNSAIVLNDIYMTLIPNPVDSKYNPLGIKETTCYLISLSKPDYSHSIVEKFLKNYSQRKCIPPYGLNVMISNKCQLQINELKGKKDEIYNNLFSHLQSKDPSPQLRCYERNNELFISYKSNVNSEERIKIFEDLKANIKDIINMKSDVFLEYTITFVIKNRTVGNLIKYIIIFFFGAFTKVNYNDNTSLSIICQNHDLAYSLCNYINSILNSEEYLIPVYLLQFNNLLKNPIIDNNFITTLTDKINKKIEEVYSEIVKDQENKDPKEVEENGIAVVEDIKKFFYLEKEDRKIKFYCDNHFKNILIPIFKKEVEIAIDESIKKIKEINNQFFFLVPSLSMKLLNNSESKKVRMKEDKSSNNKNNKKNKNKKNDNNNNNQSCNKRFSSIYRILGLCSKLNCEILMNNRIVEPIEIKENQFYSLCCIDKEKYENIDEIYNEIKTIYENNNDGDDNNGDEDEEDKDIGLCFNTCDKNNYKLAKCSHRVCVDCLKDYITNIVSSKENEIDLKIECKLCNRKLSSYEIYSVLNEDILMKLFNKMSREYSNRNRDKYYICPYEDCERILMKKKKEIDEEKEKEEEEKEDDSDSDSDSDKEKEKEKDEAVEKDEENGIYIRCKSCGNISCCKCGNKCHFNKSCSGEALPDCDKIKHCPKCGTATEKSEGCNHIRCTVCTIHWCWNCGKYYEIPDLLYEHMRSEHGGISFVDDDDDDDDDDDGDE